MKQIDDIIPSGEHFIEWLKEAILTQKLIINEPLALVDTVETFVEDSDRVAWQRTFRA